MKKLRLDDLELSGKTVLVRVDFNVPLAGEGPNVSVADDTRIRAALPTINKITSSGGRAVLFSHLGRPKGEPDPRYSLRPVADHLSELVSTNVRFVPALEGDAVVEAIAGLKNGEILLLENTRFDPRETENEDSLSRSFAALCDLYVNDAFGSAHRAHASTEGVAQHVAGAAMGYLLEREVNYLGRLLEKPDHPFVAILGGAKVSDKIGVIEHLLPRVDRLLIGGAMSYTFLRATGLATGASRVEEDRFDDARALLRDASEKIVLPVDHVVADRFSQDANRRTVKGAIEAGWMGLDIGPDTIALYSTYISKARTVVWNGPMGVFEMPPFAEGTTAIARMLADATARGALTVVGGGDSVAAVTQGGFQDDVSHVSTGGGAMLEFLEGKVLPGVAALSDR
jgi:phosphoglycerate kinase